MNILANKTSLPVASQRGASAHQRRVVTNETGGMAEAVEPHVLAVAQLVPTLCAARCSSRSVAILPAVSTQAWQGQVALT